jgi:hypothetical protein
METIIYQATNELRELEAQLDRELVNNPTFKKIKALKALIAAYGDHDPMYAKLADVVSGAGDQPRPESRKAKIKKAVRLLIERDGGQTTRQTILKYLVDQAIVPKAQATRIVAPILSEATEFTSDKKGSWRLASSSPAPTPPEHGGANGSL